MSNPWIEHVRNYQKQNGCSYREAMSRSKDSYQKQTGGSLKSVVRKAGKTVKQARKGARQVSKQVEKNQAFINLINEDAGAKIAKANSKFKEVDDKVGGKFNLGKAIRKTKNTVKKARKMAKVGAPIAMALGQPELAVGLEAVSMGAGNKYIKAIEGGYNTCSKCSKSGGSFAVPKRGGSYQNTNSTILNPQHPGFVPLKPKTMARKQKEN